jgi:DNA polymerase-3 subunit alpha (Gram-positive type)
MVYLINQGMEEIIAFNIMESVRKGEGLLPEWEKEMSAVGVPDWYIWSCKRISYMFPKAHAAAYVMMAYRIAYCKINYPLAYYAAHFGIRAKAFDYVEMCHGQERVIYHINILRDKINEQKGRRDALTQKEQDSYEDLKLVQEMYARGFEFAPIDIYQAKADRFLIVDGKLMPSLITINGLGEKAAKKVAEESRKGKYLSVDDFRQRTKVTSTVIDLMEELELFGSLPKCNQISLFDL